MPTRIDTILPVGSSATDAAEGPGDPIENAECWSGYRLELRIKVLFVEDMVPCAKAFKRALSAYGIDVVVAVDLSQARQLLRKRGEKFDAVLLDLHLPDGRGEELLPEIEALARQPGIVIFSDFLDEVRPEVASYRVVLAPKTIGPSALAALLHQGANGYAGDTVTRFARNYGLTGKESEVLGHVAMGFSPKQIAAELACSVQIVYVRLAGVCAKTACSCYHEIVAKLFQFSCHGLGHDAATRQAVGIDQVPVGRKNSVPA